MKRFMLTAALAAAITTASGALDIDAASGRFGVAIINNKSDLGTIDPAIVNTLGGSMVVSFAKGFFLNLQPSLDLFWTNYEYYNGRAVPTEPSERGQGNNVSMIGFMIDLPLTASYRFNDRIGAAASIGTAFLLRASFAGDTSTAYETEMAANLAAISSYFWSQGRWFYPSASLRMEVFLQENFTFAFGVRGFMPVFNAWTDNPVFWDEGILQVTMAMIVGL